MRIKYLLTILLSFYFGLLSSQIKIRLFSDFTPDYVIFTVDSGEYQLSNGSGRSITATNGDMLIICRYNGKIFVKKRYGESFTGDSIDLRGSTGEDYFALQINQPESLKRNFSGDLKCFSDMGTLFLINTFDIEKYIAGVVMAEGGGRRNDEYFKTQAIIARTYTYKYLNRHILDKFNLCDDTHCQAFNGLTSDSLIINAVRSTSGLVITTSDSIPIISAFHSNCGGETSPSEYAWVTGQNYLKKVSDPYCQSSRSALWEKKISVLDWADYLKKNGYKKDLTDPADFNFVQNTRVSDYVSGSFTMPLRTIRNDLDLRSTYFSVSVTHDSLTISGRGYGHGVGLCQEGAMVMAAKGFNYKQIIEFYYSDVIIIDIKNAVLLPQINP